MQLININKARYRKHLNIVIVACILALLVGCLAISQSLIALFPDESGSHFHWNLLGVIAAGVVVALLLNKFRYHDFMTEVAYVWDLKQSLNKINRKMPKLKLAAQAGNIDALVAMEFCYAGSRQLWQLDDNTLVMDELVVKQAELDALAEKYKVTLRAADYEQTMLQQF
ncbi:DUF3087 domain-containing protein [Paraglaciecola aquimarina]|uniref:DUF3087 domain-containing protein n=1 Tax=Paraglaciecola aquimarina TaxID=1235557 RepID=A0ABU3T2I9_9ALTE|nr:DUF3087 domain-containing protein [Paraglaciecola aquimarina]MDU0356423.1 DUF3087 domain-containing protein [Paraglaciecola aquimarina]